MEQPAALFRGQAEVIRGKRILQMLRVHRAEDWEDRKVLGLQIGERDLTRRLLHPRFGSVHS
jgi:hypothetical protein